ncbi:hypothetical protein FVR03_05755 [Pontibacter qinzhouensis]|uniref:Uncharacterized protein n=1 Tax=Pontibacter qinzhouensis TaxID=2603253 RepID=A0A5C8KAY0_9BACT|nr:hypothetical protein [Pontibacter qinzhouensis]TXK49825.1 hypothetical protein FVR03_05755 [Pontibacter qinzhouensis]
MSEKFPLKKRHYSLVEGLFNETQQDLPESGMRRRAIAMGFLEKFLHLPQQPSMTPSADGSLEAIIFTIPDHVLEGTDNPLWKAYKDLFLKLPVYTQLQLMVHEQVAEEVALWLQQNGLEQKAHLHKVPSHYHMYIWAEDAYEVITDKSDGKRYLVQPHSNRRGADSLVSYLTSRALGHTRVTIPLYFEGGNILIGDDFFLMGADYGIDSMLDLKGVLPLQNGVSATETVAKLFKQYFDKERRLIFVGSTLYVPGEEIRKFRKNGIEWTETFHTKNQEGTVQPLFHIDMFITLAGRNSQGQYQLVVGDTRMAAELLGEELMQYSIPDVFDDIAEYLQGLGFVVYRNPLPVTCLDDEEKKTRKWYYATSNNALVEIKSIQDKTIWLPSYGHGSWPELKKTDEANRQLWEELGFRVVMLEDFHPFAENSGSVHCIKKYLQRGNMN